LVDAIPPPEVRLEPVAQDVVEQRRVAGDSVAAGTLAAEELGSLTASIGDFAQHSTDGHSDGH
jgi:hypothetical protein